MYYTCSFKFSFRAWSSWLGPVNAEGSQGHENRFGQGIVPSGASETQVESKKLDGDTPPDIADGLFDDDLGHPELL